MHIYGRLSDGRSFLVRDFQQEPFFYIRSSDAQKARELGAKKIRGSEKISFEKEAVSRVSVTIPSDAPPLRERLHQSGIQTFEADVRFATRYLIDRNIRASCSIEGSLAEGPGETECVFDDPVLQPKLVDYSPKVLSFDIETDPEGNSLLAISVFLKHPALFVDEVVVVDAQEREVPEKVIKVSHEKEAILWFVNRVREIDPDILTGWNVVDFDLNVLQKISSRHGIQLNLGRDKRGLRIRSEDSLVQGKPLSRGAWYLTALTWFEVPFFVLMTTR